MKRNDIRILEAILENNAWSVFRDIKMDGTVMGSHPTFWYMVDEGFLSRELKIGTGVLYHLTFKGKMYLAANGGVT
jgi:hypothetical protein